MTNSQEGNNLHVNTYIFIWFKMAKYRYDQKKKKKIKPGQLV